MNDRELERQARALLEPLARQPVPVASPSDAEQRFARLASRLEDVIGEVRGRQPDVERRRSQRGRWALAAAAATAAVAAAAAVFLVTRQSSLPRGASELRVLEGRLLGQVNDASAAGVIATPEDEAARVLERGGVELTIARGSRLDLAALDSGRRVVLLRGAADFDVPHVQEGQTFVVVTPDLKVIVHGTRFHVGLRQASTCVSVSRGLVEVEQRGGERRFLPGGASWGCEPLEPETPNEGGPRPVASTQPQATPEGPAPAVQHARELPSSPQGSRRKRVEDQSAPAPEKESALAEQVRLLGDGLAAEQRGDLTIARATLKRLIEKYPSSAVAAEARGLLQRVADRENGRGP